MIATILFTLLLTVWVGAPVAAYYAHLRDERAHRLFVMELDALVFEANAQAWEEAELARLDAEALATHNAYHHAYDDETKAERWLALQDEILQDLQAQRDSCADLA